MRNPIRKHLMFDFQRKIHLPTPRDQREVVSNDSKMPRKNSFELNDFVKLESILHKTN